MINKIISLSRIKKQVIMSLFDALLIVIVLLLSFSLRLSYWYFPEGISSWIIFGAPIIALPIFWRFGLYLAIIRYIDFKALWTVVQAVSLYSLLWGIVSFMAAIDGLPRSVILINWFFSILLIGGFRITAHAMLTGNFDIPVFNVLRKKNQKRSLIYGAGDAGIQLSSALEHSSEFHTIGFIDDVKELQ